MNQVPLPDGTPSVIRDPLVTRVTPRSNAPASSRGPNGRAGMSSRHDGHGEPIVVPDARAWETTVP